MMNVLVSYCLLGKACRYDGRANAIEDLQGNFPEINFIGVCPEVAGGLLTPRKPCELKNSQVINSDGEDKTREFQRGAKAALHLCKKHGITVALLKAKSPSCGKDFIYDGSFSGKLVRGSGITCKLLREHRIIVFSERELEKFSRYTRSIQSCR